MNLVVDCSFIMSTILPEEQQKFLNLSCHRIYVPSIFFLECSNVLASAVRQQRINETDHSNYLEILSKLPVTVDKFSSSAEALHFISKLSKKYSLSSYDASYLELAIRYNATMATYDKNLQNACSLAKVTLI